MRINRNAVITLSLLLGVAIGVYAQDTTEPKSISVNLYYRRDWVMAPPVVDATGSNVTNSVYMTIVRYVDPHKGFPYDDSEPKFGFDLNDLVHSFRLEKGSFLLGEPIPVEHRIELNGPGELNWFTGGNYRARGRDDNFSLVLRKADGALVPDVYPRITGMVMGGGFGGDHTIKKDKPLSYWLGLQQYSAITEPGVYHLYCMTGNKAMGVGKIEALKAAIPEGVALDHYVDDSGVLIDRETGEKSTRYALEIKELFLSSGNEWPLTRFVPSEVLRFAGEQSIGFSFAQPATFGTIAHFKINIRMGARAERKAMIASWTKTIKADSGIAVMGSYKAALLDSIWYAQQDDFLPLIEEWISSVDPDEEFSSTILNLDGLAMRSDSAAFKLLLQASPKQVNYAFSLVHQQRIPEAIPLCIAWLTHADNEVRALAEWHLMQWTGQSFERTWDNYNYQRPTLAEGQRMQPFWRAWWEKNKKTFKPRPPKDF